MYRTKFIVTSIFFITLLIATSLIKNKTRIIEKKISFLNTKISLKKKDINESQLDYHYISSPAEIEKKIKNIGYENYEPILYSKIFFNFSDFMEIENKISTSRVSNEKKVKK